MYCNKIKKNCPKFKIGTCKVIDCDYAFHNKCYKNMLCDNYECNFGHGVTVEKRKLIISLYNKMDKYIINESAKCKFAINCFNVNCTLNHYLKYDDRKILNQIINAKTYEEAEKIYNNNKDEKLSACSTVFNSPEKLTSESNPVPLMLPSFFSNSLNDVFSPIESPTQSPILVPKKQPNLDSNKIKDFYINKIKVFENKIKKYKKILEDIDDADFSI